MTTGSRQRLCAQCDDIEIRIDDQILIKTLDRFRGIRVEGKPNRIKKKKNNGYVGTGPSLLELGRSRPRPQGQCSVVPASLGN